MSAQIIPFPRAKRTLAFTIPLYGEEEVNMILAAINLFGPQITKDEQIRYVTRATLKFLKPRMVADILNIAYRSDIFATKGKDILKRIINNIEMDKTSKVI